MNAVDELNLLLGIGPRRPSLPASLQRAGYTPVRTLGKGSFGQALLLFHKQHARYYVAKHIHVANLSPRQRRDVQNEIALLQQLRHPNIVRYVDCFDEQAHLYLVMEYADGGDLYAYLRRLQQEQQQQQQTPSPPSSPAAAASPSPPPRQQAQAQQPQQQSPPPLLLSEAQVLSLFVQTTMAIKYMHERRLLHRDIKSQNVFLTRDKVVKLGDFGISTALQSTLAMANTVCGTPCYFSPELCEGRPYNNKSDIWALGVLLYELCTQRMPFASTNMKQLMRDIVSKQPVRVPGAFSDALWRVVCWCLQKDPARRPDAQQLLYTPALMQRVPDVVTLLVSQCAPRASSAHAPHDGASSASSSAAAAEWTTDTTPYTQLLAAAAAAAAASSSSSLSSAHSHTDSGSSNNKDKLGVAQATSERPAALPPSAPPQRAAPRPPPRHALVATPPPPPPSSSPSPSAAAAAAAAAPPKLSPAARASIVELIARYDREQQRLREGKAQQEQQQRQQRQQQQQQQQQHDATNDAASPPSSSSASSSSSAADDKGGEDVAAHEAQRVAEMTAVVAALQTHLTLYEQTAQHTHDNNDHTPHNNDNNDSSRRREAATRTTGTSATAATPPPPPPPPPPPLLYAGADFSDAMGACVMLDALPMDASTSNNKDDDDDDDAQQQHSHVRSTQVTRTLNTLYAKPPAAAAAAVVVDGDKDTTTATPPPPPHNASSCSRGKDSDDDHDVTTAAAPQLAAAATPVPHHVRATRDTHTAAASATMTTMSREAGADVPFAGACLCSKVVVGGGLSCVYGSFVCDCDVCVRTSGSASGVEWLHLPDTTSLHAVVHSAAPHSRDKTSKDSSSSSSVAAGAGAVAANTLQKVSANGHNDSNDASSLHCYAFVRADGPYTHCFCASCGCSVAMLHAGIAGVLVCKAVLDSASQGELARCAYTVYTGTQAPAA